VTGGRFVAVSSAEFGAAGSSVGRVVGNATAEAGLEKVDAVGESITSEAAKRRMGIRT
jgi:hypothetical protein